MANQIIVIALIFVAAVGMAAGTPAPSLAPAAAATTGSGLSEGPIGASSGLSEGPTGESTDNTIGTISGGSTASDAAPVGGPVPDGVFEDLTPSAEPASTTANGATALEVTVVAAAGVIGSLFL